MTDKSGQHYFLSSSPAKELAMWEFKQQNKAVYEMDKEDGTEAFEAYRHNKSRASRSFFMMRKRELVIRCIRDVLKGNENKFSAETYKGKPLKSPLKMSDLKYLEKANSERSTVGNEIAHGLDTMNDAFLIRKYGPVDDLFHLGKIFEAIYDTELQDV